MHLREIKKVFSTTQEKIALNNINIKFDNGLYILIGQNGAGKTTLINIMSGALIQDSGDILCNGNIVSRDFLYRNVYVVIAGDRAINWRCTVEHNIYYYLTLKGKEKLEIKRLLDENIDKFSRIKTLLDTRVETLSFGQKKTVQLFIGLLSGAKYLVFDEVTEAIDIEIRLELLEYIKSIDDGKRCLIFATHDIDFAQRLHGIQIFMHNGNIYKITDDKNIDIVETYKEMTGIGGGF